MPATAPNTTEQDGAGPSTFTIPSAYLAAPFISPKAVGEQTSTVQEDLERRGESSTSTSSPSVSSSSPSQSPSNTASTSAYATSPNGEANEIPTYLYSNLPRHLLLPSGTPDYLRMSLSADIYNLVKTTPLQRANKLSAKLGCEIFLKREDLQPVFSFKLRGAYNLMRTLEGEQRWKGVIACSAGNHAQGVSLSGLSLSIPCTIVMPLGTPSIKVDSVRALGAKVVLHGQDFDEAKAECSRLAETYGLKVIPPFDDPHVIAGQGTVAVEILRQTSMDDLDGVFCCVGGGGLLAGVASYVKRIAPPRCKVYGVETFDGDALTQSLQQGKRIRLKDVGLFADGTAVKIVGEECWRILKEKDVVDGMIRVSTDEICAAIRDTFEDTRTVPEPSGALSLAGLKRYIMHHNLQGSGKKFACVVSGANMNFSRLRFVAERAEVGDGKEVLMMVEIPETPGSFMKLHSHIYPRSVTEFSYRYNVTEGSAAGDAVAHIYLSFLLSGKTGTNAAAASTTSAGPSSAAPSSATSAYGGAAFNPASMLNGAINGDAADGRHHLAPASLPPTSAGHHVTGVNALTSRFNQSASLSHSNFPSGHLAGAQQNSHISNSILDPTSILPLNGASNGAEEVATNAPSTQPAVPATLRDLELEEIMNAMAADGMRATDISGNEMAKSHGRYLVGGRQRVPNERLIRFEFPERPGALRKFLVALNAGWNITLFHYRDQGSDIAKILAGIQVPQQDGEAFERFLEELGYVWTDETDNEVASRFL